MEIFVMKGMGNILMPADDEASEALSKLKLGNPFKAVFTLIRNYKFHKKYFTLLNFAFDVWNPVLPTWRGQIIQKERNEFRKNIIILAGYGYPVFDIQGNLRMRAKSISFAKMNQEEFEKLYSATVNVILEKILTNYTKDDLENVINQLLGFTWLIKRSQTF